MSVYSDISGAVFNTDNVQAATYTPAAGAAFAISAIPFNPGRAAMGADDGEHEITDYVFIVNRATLYAALGNRTPALRESITYGGNLYSIHTVTEDPLCYSIQTQLSRQVDLMANGEGIQKQ